MENRRERPLHPRLFPTEPEPGQGQCGYTGRQTPAQGECRAGVENSRSRWEHRPLTPLRTAQAVGPAPLQVLLANHAPHRLNGPSLEMVPEFNVTSS